MAEQAPVRLSVDDEDFDTELGRRCRVFLDGVEIDQVIAYDIDAGTVTRLRTDANGNIVAVLGEVLNDTLTGVVEVTLTPRGAEGTP